MKSLVFRFRDLSIPSGETIRRHSTKIESHHWVWWGWIKRQSEHFPTEKLKEFSRISEPKTGSEIYLYHSGENNIYPAQMSEIAAYPGGYLISTPEQKRTPAYMAEAECPAWLKLISIKPALENPKIKIISHPTLQDNLPDVDRDLLNQNYIDASKLRLSSATLWEADIS